MKSRMNSVLTVTLNWLRKPVQILLLLLVAGCTVTGFKKETLQFIVLGDWGMQGAPVQIQVAQQMDLLAATTGIDFIVTTGDNFYPFGVKSIDDPLWQKNYESVYSLPHLKDVPWYITLGNHDYFGDFNAELAYAREHPRWILPANYYSRDFKLGGRQIARLLFVDSNPYVLEYHKRPDLYHHIETQDPVAQTAWLDQALNDERAVWKLIFAHHPLYTSGAHGNTVELISAWSGLFEQRQVHAYFAGHDHHLEHIKPQAYTHYFISGGGGAATRRTGSGPDTRFSLSSHGFAHVTLDASCMQVRFIDQEGAELYRTVVPSTAAASCTP